MLDTTVQHTVQHTSFWRRDSAGQRWTPLSSTLSSTPCYGQGIEQDIAGQRWTPLSSTLSSTPRYGEGTALDTSPRLAYIIILKAGRGWQVKTTEHSSIVCQLVSQTVYHIPRPPEADFSVSLFLKSQNLSCWCLPSVSPIQSLLFKIIFGDPTSEYCLPSMLVWIRTTKSDPKRDPKCTPKEPQK